MSGCHIPVATGVCVFCVEMVEKLEKKVNNNHFMLAQAELDIKKCRTWISGLDKRIEVLESDLGDLRDKIEELENKINSDAKPNENSGVTFKHIPGTTSEPFKWEKPKKQKFEVGERIAAYETTRLTGEILQYDKSDDTYNVKIDIKYHDTFWEREYWFHEKQIRRIKKK